MSEEGRKTIRCEMLWFLLEDAWMWNKREKEAKQKQSWGERGIYVCFISIVFLSPPFCSNIYLRMASLHHEKQQEQRQQH